MSYIISFILHIFILLLGLCYLKIKNAEQYKDFTNSYKKNDDMEENYEKKKSFQINLDNNNIDNISNSKNLIQKKTKTASKNKKNNSLKKESFKDFIIEDNTESHEKCINSDSNTAKTENQGEKIETDENQIIDKKLNAPKTENQGEKIETDENSNKDNKEEIIIEPIKEVQNNQITTINHEAISTKTKQQSIFEKDFPRKIAILFFVPPQYRGQDLNFYLTITFDNEGYIKGFKINNIHELNIDILDLLLDILNSDIIKNEKYKKQANQSIKIFIKIEKSIKNPKNDKKS